MSQRRDNWSRRGRSGAGLLPALLLAATAAWYSAPAFGASMALMPVRDLTGDPVSVQVLKQALWAELSLQYELADSVQLRDALRRLRIRDARSVAPEMLRRVADELGVDWVFIATLHRCALEPMPMVTVSAQVMHRGEQRLVWAGFESLTAMDEVGLLGRGWVGDLDTLEQMAAAKLAAGFTWRGNPAQRAPRPASRLFRRLALDVEAAGTIAVLPFEGTTGVGATNTGLMATDLAYAALWRQGATLALPGAVAELLRGAEATILGILDHSTRSRLAGELDADLLFTGTVETFEFIQQGAEPEPAVALAVRIIEPRTGRLLAHGGAEREGWDRQRLFRRGRVHSPERLAQLIMESLVADLGEKGGY
jgi:hypothetical protein